MAKTYTSVPTVSTLATYPSATYNTYTAQNINNLIVPPAVRAQRTTETTVASDANIPWHSVTAAGTFDTDAMWSASNPERLTINTAGIYVVTLNLFPYWTGTATQVGPYINSQILGGFIAQDQRVGTFTNTNQPICLSVTVPLAAGDYLTARFGLIGVATYTINATTRSAFSAVWVGRTS